jgi:hypothetical protein
MRLNERIGQSSSTQDFETNETPKFYQVLHLRFALWCCSFMSLFGGRFSQVLPRGKACNAKSGDTNV